MSTYVYMYGWGGKAGPRSKNPSERQSKVSVALVAIVEGTAGFSNTSECARYCRETGRLSTFHDNNVRIQLQPRRSRTTASAKSRPRVETTSRSVGA